MGGGGKEEDIFRALSNGFSCRVLLLLASCEKMTNRENISIVCL
jgi:hypothetical protein